MGGKKLTKTNQNYYNLSNGARWFQAIPLHNIENESYFEYYALLPYGLINKRK